METTDYKRLFQLVAKSEAEGRQNLEEIESRLQHLKKGAALTYEDLETIADPACWRFSRYWIWPHRSQIEKDLPKTSGWFKDLPDGEVETIKKLDSIFKNIELVSIILRFARPDLYAIYSRPVLKILRVERGQNDVEEYLNYIKQLRILREVFHVNKTADADKIVWAISRLRGRYATELKRILAKYLPENLTPEELIIYLADSPLEIARIYMKKKDYKTAGLWAGKAFDKFLDDECRNNGKLLEEKPDKRCEMISFLCKSVSYWKEYRNLLYGTKSVRNKIVPGTRQFTADEAGRFIDNIQRLMDISNKFKGGHY